MNDKKSLRSKHHPQYKKPNSAIFLNSAFPTKTKKGAWDPAMCWDTTIFLTLVEKGTPWPKLLLVHSRAALYITWPYRHIQTRVYSIPVCTCPPLPKRLGMCYISSPRITKTKNLPSRRLDRSPIDVGLPYQTHSATLKEKLYSSKLGGSSLGKRNQPRNFTTSAKVRS